MYKKIDKCRICGNENLISLIDLGKQTLTGIFPRSKSAKLTEGPLELVKCHNKDNTTKCCGLVQLHHSYESSEMYGENYGYRSGLNQSMVKHLQSIVTEITKIAQLKSDDIIIDIGGNDGTLLSTYPSDKGYKLIVIDPTGSKFKKYHPKHIELIADFFTATTFNNKFPGKKAKIITSIAMFYDLEKPLDFVKDVYDVLSDDGIWVFEQSYLPLMLKTSSYDTICHEHLEYYGLKQIKWMMDKTGFTILNVEQNNINGGSFRVTVCKNPSVYKIESEKIKSLLKDEQDYGIDGLEIYETFSQNVKKHKEELTKLLKELKASGKKVFGYGASTKGNVILQYCGLTDKDIPCIAEVNEDKLGSYTPATHIPIVSEKQARSEKPDYFLVLPWHFKEGIVVKEKDYLESGGKLIFPLPQIEQVSK